MSYGWADGEAKAVVPWLAAAEPRFPLLLSTLFSCVSPLARGRTPDCRLSRMADERVQLRKGVGHHARQEEASQGDQTPKEGRRTDAGAPDSTADRRGQEDRLRRLSPSWWERDPARLEAELEPLRRAGFRVTQVFGRTNELWLLVRRGTESYALTYPYGFPAMPVVASDLGASFSRYPAQAARIAPSGAGLLALVELCHAPRSHMDFPALTFGVILTDGWDFADGDDGTLLARTSGRGSAIVPSGVTGTAAGAEVARAAKALSAFDQQLSGFWVRGEAADWNLGPDAVAAALEKLIVERHGAADTDLAARPVLALVSPPLLLTPTRQQWLFFRRTADGEPAFGQVEWVNESSFSVRAPYADALANKRVAIVGCGSLGWPIAIGLARAGVRHFSLFDLDRLRAGNLARLGAQLGQVGEHKVEALADALRQVASGVTVETNVTYVGHLVGARALAGAKPTLIVDTAADEATPNEVNAAALSLRVPALYAWMTRGVRSARLFRVVPGRTACYACVANARPRSLVEEARSLAYEFIWIGANWNIDPIAAAAVRMAVLTLAGDPVDETTNPDHVVLRVGGPVPLPETLRFERDPSCQWCGGP